MKRLFFACFLLVATCSVTSFEHASAQTVPVPTVTLADFTTKINLMDSYIAASNILAATTTWNEVHTMMMNVLGKSKQSIYGATSPADKDAHVLILQNQQDIYHAIWALKTDLALNRTAIHTKLVSFGATIY